GVDGLVGTGDDVTTTYGFAVGNGAEASLKFTGTTFDAVASTLNGRSAITGVTTNAAVTGHANFDANQSNLVVFTANPTAAQSFTGGSAADIFLDISAGVGTAYNVSTGAGNDAIVIAQTNTGAHTITGGTGADRVVLSAAAGVDTVVLTEGDSTASAWDVITNFKTGADKLDLSSFTTGAAAKLTSTVWADIDADAAAETVAVAATGEVTIGLSGGGNAVIGKDVSVASVVSFLAANSTTVNDTFFFRYDSNGSGAIDAADNAIFFQNLGTDLVVELVGSATNSVAGFSVAADLI
ncbi:MAG: M10 family metallopeptidase C-terminal domain-containing protein, partial [Pseudomonadota bacterium]